jgi:hypothetical protein
VDYLWWLAPRFAGGADFHPNHALFKQCDENPGDESAEKDFVENLAWMLPKQAELYILKSPLFRYIETPEPMGGGVGISELLVTLIGNLQRPMRVIG